MFDFNLRYRGIPFKQHVVFGSGDRNKLVLLRIVTVRWIGEVLV